MFGPESSSAIESSAFASSRPRAARRMARKGTQRRRTGARSCLGEPGCHEGRQRARGHPAEPAHKEVPCDPDRRRGRRRAPTRGEEDEGPLPSRSCRPPDRGSRRGGSRARGAGRANRRGRLRGPPRRGRLPPRAPPAARAGGTAPRAARRGRTGRGGGAASAPPARGETGGVPQLRLLVSRMCSSPRMPSGKGRMSTAAGSPGRNHLDHSAHSPVSALS